jgi:hypothetical protein
LHRKKNTKFLTSKKSPKKAKTKNGLRKEARKRGSIGIKFLFSVLLLFCKKKHQSFTVMFVDIFRVVVEIRVRVLKFVEIGLFNKKFPQNSSNFLIILQKP